MGIKKLLFVDTNIWLDFYRTNNDVSLQLLKYLEDVAKSGLLIITYQQEMEFRKNRQKVMKDSLSSLKFDSNVSCPAFLTGSNDGKALLKSLSEIKSRIKALREKIKKAIDNPVVNDEVYKACQRVFGAVNILKLDRENKIRKEIRRKALRRFLHGCPPRKSNDTSMGDAINWEWMVECALTHQAEIVIVSRDADYGDTVDNATYLNDHLRQEFSDRVSQKRKVYLKTNLSDALRLLNVKVSKNTKDAEEKALSKSPAVIEKKPKLTEAQLLELIGDLLG